MRRVLAFGICRGRAFRESGIGRSEEMADIVFLTVHWELSLCFTGKEATCFSSLALQQQKFQRNVSILCHWESESKPNEGRIGEI